MPPVEPWEDAWLNNKQMPQHNFPTHLLDDLLELAERWVLGENGPRKQLEEFVSQGDSFTVIGGLVYNGFCVDRKVPQRIRLVPVITQMLYRASAFTDSSEIEPAMIRVFAQVLSDWCRLQLSGQKYEIAP